MTRRQYTDELPESTIAAALTYVPADLARDEWAQVAMALKSELGEAGFALFDQWSQGGRSYNARDCRDTWKSIHAGGAVTIGTLIHMAKQGGFRLEAAERNTLTPQESEARRQQREAQEARDREIRARQAARARTTAAGIWEAARPVDEGAQPIGRHPYLAKKFISTPGKVRIGTWVRWHDDADIEIPGTLLIPIRNAAGELVSLQGVFPSADNPLGRDRDYLPGGDKQGCWFNIGKPRNTPGERVVIGEGYATMATIHAATEYVVVVAFDAGNLPAVAQAIRAKLPAAEIIVAADNDRFGRRNTGVLKAEEAARLVAGKVAIPEFDSDQGEPTDFNDLAQEQGLEAVAAQIAAARPPRPEAADDEPASEFGAPVDPFGMIPPPEIPVDVLPAALRRYVADQADLLGCDASIIGLGALAAAAACIDDGIRLQPKRHDITWTESARIWVAVVGDPSTKKSPAIAKATRIVKKIDHRLAEQNASEAADYRHQHDQWREAKKADKSNPPPEPPAPKVQRLVVEDITVEALTEVLKDNPRGVLTLKDELTGWFASMDAYKSGAKGASMDRAHWLEAYNGGRRVIDRIARGNVIVPNWSTCILGGVQPDMIRRVASSMGNDGLLQRFIVLCAKPAREDADRVPDMDAMRGFQELFEKLARLQPGEAHVTLESGAHDIRERVASHARRMIQALDHPHLQAWLGKWDGLYNRLLLVYHVIDCALAGVYPSDAKVSAGTAALVERLLCGFLLHHAIHFYAEIVDANERQEHVRQLARLVLAKRFDRITRRDITTLWKASRRLEWWETRAVIDQLCAMDWLIPDREAMDTDGRPRAWYVNPAVHRVFDQQGRREAARRQAAAEVIRGMREAYGSQ